MSYNEKGGIPPKNVTKDREMERNREGYPAPLDDTQGGECMWGNDATLGDKPLAYAYVPVQLWRKLYTPEDGLTHGTLFEELDKPKGVYGNEW